MKGLNLLKPVRKLADFETYSIKGIGMVKKNLFCEGKMAAVLWEC
jgi:hypothetical protein